jgi:hypothetical protein
MSNLKRGFQFLGQYARLFATAAGLRWPVLLSLGSGLAMALVALIPILLSRAFLMG